VNHWTLSIQTSEPSDCDATFMLLYVRDVMHNNISAF